MKEDFTKEDVEKKPAGKKDRLEVFPGVETSADLLTKPAGKKDRLNMAHEVEPRQHNKKKKKKRKMKEEFTKDDVEKKTAGKKDRLELAPGVETSADLLTKPAGKKDRLNLAPGVEPRQHNKKTKKKRKMKEEFTKDDIEKKPASKKDRLELAPGVEPSADLVTKPAGEKDRLKLAPGVESMSQNISPLHDAAVAAAAINQACTSRRSRCPPSQQDEDESSSIASSTSSPRPGAVRVGDTERNHDELTLQTQEEPDTEQGFEAILPIAAEVVLAIPEGNLPDDESENNKTIAEAQIVETAKVCGQPRWLIFALLGVLVAVAIGVGLGVALGSGGDASVRRAELEKVLIAEIQSVQFGSSQIEAIDWLANEDPAMLDFKTTPIRTILERYVVVTLYYSLNGPDWENQRGFLSEESVCNWSLIKATETTIKGVLGVGCNEIDQVVSEINLSENQLIGKIPREIGLLASLTLMDLSKFLSAYLLTKCPLSLTLLISIVLRQV
jgi:hypothetical protein